jgi:hypothetical protein
MTCERCYQPTTEGEHGVGLCPFLPRDIGLSVVGDDIPGGLWVEHGLCNPDGTPRKYYTKGEMAREAKARGLINWVEHKGDRGSDKSPHTSRWI